MPMREPANLPPPILTDGTNAFAYNTMRVRHPQMLQNVLNANPNFPAVVRDALQILQEDLQSNAPVPVLNLFPSPAPDYVDWATAYIERRTIYSRGGSPSWLNVDWFFAETMLFRAIMEAVRWWELGRDPYAPIKEQELSSADLWDLLEMALQLEGGVVDRLPQLIRFATWGNRMDLSYAASMEQGALADDGDLLVDDSETVKEHMIRAQLEMFPHEEQGASHIIVDNHGTELAMDLALTDALLTGFSDVVVLHVKYHPTFVSDATAYDVRDLIERCVSGNHGGRTSPQIFAMGQRLQAALNAGRLRLAPHFFWNSCNFMWQMPQILQRIFDGAQLAILKGDANYRRAVGDALWNATTPFDDVVDYFPCPLLALRTLKSDPIVGLPPGMAGALDDVDSEWRVNGRRGVVQLSV
ncbi:MAG: damage-control phosphatase ARMT1 family protein [Chloroflexota bacterium]